MRYATKTRSICGHAKAVEIALALAALLPVGSWGGPLSGDASDPVPALGERLGGAVEGTVHPAYRFVEGISDGIYDFMRDHVIRNIMPGRLSRNLRAAPGRDSAPLFDRNLREKESRFLQRAREAYPILDDKAGPSDTVRLQEWRSWAAEEQVSVTVDALKDTLLERYQLELFGRSSQAYARERRNLDPGFMTMAGLVGGALLYANGMHAVAHMGCWKLAVDLRSGARLRQALQEGASSRRLAGLELGYKDKPLALAADWGAQGGRLRGERVGLVYRLRY